MYTHFFPWGSSYTHTFKGNVGWGKRTCPRFETASVGFEFGTSGFRDPRSYPLGHLAPLKKEPTCYYMYIEHTIESTKLLFYNRHRSRIPKVYVYVMSPSESNLFWSSVPTYFENYVYPPLSRLQLPLFRICHSFILILVFTVLLLLPAATPCIMCIYSKVTEM